ncbi:MAG: OsmC family protein [Anaerolineales bacterium]|nr:OsmC family protein [Anaerolineales bacterium]
MALVSSTVGLKWVDATLMVGSDSNGRPIVIGSKGGKDQPPGQPSWLGLKASDLLLLSAASCSAYDVITILEKQREPLEDLEVTCTGQQNSEPPYVFETIHLHYRAKGKVSAEKLARAIHLSEDKYCSVLNTLRASVQLSSDFEIL